MATWLVADLTAAAAADVQWTIVYFHHPPYSKGSHDSDSESQLIDMRENFNPILELFGVDLVLCGHSHSYERTSLIHGHYGSSETFDSTTHVVAGGDGNAVPYAKAAGMEHPGTVYVVAGSAGKVDSLSSTDGLNHRAMHTSLRVTGSVIVELQAPDGGTHEAMDVKFLGELEEIHDRFRIVKPLRASPVEQGGCDSCKRGARPIVSLTEQ
eukprot:m.1099671 g.1099671  ORF g.1099671 m.1099671 type:complete len:211 (-) comp24317_c0_seq10:168-800(-)